MTRDFLTDETIEDERFELLVGASYDFTHNRREFVEVCGAGILIALATRTGLAQQAGRRGGDANRGGQNAKISDRLHIGIDGTVTVLTGKVDFGQAQEHKYARPPPKSCSCPWQTCASLWAIPSCVQTTAELRAAEPPREQFPASERPLPSLDESSSS